MSTQHHVVVVGAGYAGFIAAKRLANQVHPDSVTVTLVNARDHFVERPRLHQAATGQRTKPLPLSGLLGKSAVRLRWGWVHDIDVTGKRLRLSTADGPRSLAYDTLVLANGTVIDTTAVPGVGEHTLTLEPGRAARTSRRLATLDSGVTVVCGGGLTGIEAATELAETYPRLTVTLVSRDLPGQWLSRKARRHLDKAFDRLGIRVRSGADIVAVESGRVVLADGGSVAFDECLWAGGFAAPELAAESGLAVNRRGRAIVDETLRSVSHPDVYVIGDAAAVPGPWGTELAYGCRVGGFMGPYLADALAARLAGRTPKPFTFRYIHQCVSLGREDAVIQFVNPVDESPRNTILTGRLAVWYKELVLSSATWLFRTPGPYRRTRRVRAAATEASPAGK